MATSVNLPALGESVTEGTVTRWLKQPGDQVAVDEPLLEVSTDKVDTEIPSPVAGTLLEIKVDEDETVEVGAELCTIGEEGESSGSSGGESSEESGSDEGESRSSESEPSESEPTAGSGGQHAAEPAPAVAAESDEAADDDSSQDDSDDSDGFDGEAEDAGRKTQTETDPPPAKTEDTPPAAETAPGSADTKPESESSKAASGGSGTPVTLPALGESVTEGTVTRWLKQVGDDVAVDEPLLEVSTDKVDTEIPSPVAGTLIEIKVNEDETVGVGAELAVIGTGDSSPSGDEASAPSPQDDNAAEPEKPEPEREPEKPAEPPAAEPEKPAEPPAAEPEKAAEPPAAEPEE
ncbi:MAG: biotin/lipoyl-containing protein, partial [Nocardioides sp.]